jgi:hypothetical protein
MKLEIIVLASLALSGCSREVTPDALAGRYVANTGVDETILIKPDGTYTYTRLDSVGRVKRLDSRWTYDGVIGDCPRVTFTDFESPTGTGLWPACIERAGKRLRLIINEDDGTYYQKQ